MFERSQVDTVANRIVERDSPYIQVIVGPRQTGKTTMISQALARTGALHHFVSADDAITPSTQWLETEWQQARNMAREAPVVLVVDEIQKVPHWSAAVKSLYDRDRRENVQVKPILSGSSSLLLHKGFEDSLAGRYELIRSPHWGCAECREAFGFSLDDYLFFGGYPGAARLSSDVVRWASYMRGAIIEPTIS